MLTTDQHSGQTEFVTHACKDSVPSRRDTIRAWDNIMLTLDMETLAELERSLDVLRRALRFND